MQGNTTGSDNIATGFNALALNSTGNANLASGTSAMFSNTVGHNNVATGFPTLNLNTTGRFNVASGSKALLRNTAGHDNTALGYLALDSNKAGDNNVALGSGAGGNLTTGNDNVDIANPGVAGESGKIRIGTAGAQNAAYVAGITGTSIPGPAQSVVVNAQGQLGTASSFTKSGPSLRAKVREQQRQIERLRRQMRELAR